MALGLPKTKDLTVEVILRRIALGTAYSVGRDTLGIGPSVTASKACY